MATSPPRRTPSPIDFIDDARSCTHTYKLASNVECRMSNVECRRRRCRRDVNAGEERKGGRDGSSSKCRRLAFSRFIV